MVCIFLRKAEMKEMVDLYVQKGFSEAEASTILRIMAKQKEFFVDHMLVQVAPSWPLPHAQELGIMPPDDDSSTPIKQGLVMFGSFIGFGLVPLLGSWMPCCTHKALFNSPCHHFGPYNSLRHFVAHPLAWLRPALPHRVLAHRRCPLHPWRPEGPASFIKACFSPPPEGPASFIKACFSPPRTPDLTPRAASRTRPGMSRAFSS